MQSNATYKIEMDQSAHTNLMVNPVVITPVFDLHRWDHILKEPPNVMNINRMVFQLLGSTSVASIDITSIQAKAPIIFNSVLVPHAP